MFKKNLVIKCLTYNTLLTSKFTFTDPIFITSNPFIEDCRSSLNAHCRHGEQMRTNYYQLMYYFLQDPVENQSPHQTFDLLHPALHRCRTSPSFRTRPSSRTTPSFPNTAPCSISIQTLFLNQKTIHMLRDAVSIISFIHFFISLLTLTLQATPSMSSLI